MYTRGRIEAEMRKRLLQRCNLHEVYEELWSSLLRGFAQSRSFVQNCD